MNRTTTRTHRRIAAEFGASSVLGPPVAGLTHAGTDGWARSADASPMLSDAPSASVDIGACVPGEGLGVS